MTFVLNNALIMIPIVLLVLLVFSAVRILREYAPLLDDDPEAHDDFRDNGIRGLAFALEYCDSRGWASTRT